MVNTEYVAAENDYDSDLLLYISVSPENIILSEVKCSYAHTQFLYV